MKSLTEFIADGMFVTALDFFCDISSHFIFVSFGTCHAKICIFDTKPLPSCQVLSKWMIEKICIMSQFPVPPKSDIIYGRPPIFFIIQRQIYKTSFLIQIFVPFHIFFNARKVLLVLVKVDVRIIQKSDVNSHQYQ